MVFKHPHAERDGDCVKKSTVGVLVSSFCYGAYPLQLDYGSTPWHHCGQATPSVQHEQSDKSSRHVRANTNTCTCTCVCIMVLYIY